MPKYVTILLFCLSFSCNQKNNQELTTPFIAILGIAQDAGYPQMGCTKTCCSQAWANPVLKKYITSFALVDPANKKWWLFEATPDMKEQLQQFNKLTNNQFGFLPSGIFITHGHIGHYAGLIQLGREVMSTKELPVYVMPKMKSYLTNNGPWSQLVSLSNISLIDLTADLSISISNNFSIKPFLVPHRDEFTETIGFEINTNKHKTIFIPDIDKWSKFNKSITDMVKQCNMALLDATFYKNGELPGRPMSEVPHPFVEESMQLFSGLSNANKGKIRFIHFNHTNPLLIENSIESKTVKNNGFNRCKQLELIYLK